MNEFKEIIGEKIYHSDGSLKLSLQNYDAGHTHLHHHQSLMDQFHCHSDSNDSRSSDGESNSARRKLIIASIICVIFMIIEVIGGILANSLAIVSDAAHLLTDFASFMISLLSIWYASRPATKQMSFGYYRAEVLGAFVSVILIYVVTGNLLYFAIQRLIEKNYEIKANFMLITSIFGLTVNIIMGISLHAGGISHGHSHGSTTVDPEKSPLINHSHDHGNDKNINVRAAYIHVLGDFFQSLGVFVAALIIYFKPEWAFLDPICTFLFSFLVLITTFNIIKDVLNVLMEGIPKGIDFLKVHKAMDSIPGVIKVHNLRIWSLNMDKVALSAHIVCAQNEDQARILRKASQRLRSEFDIFDLTLQVEEYKEEMDECTQCQSLN